MVQIARECMPGYSFVNPAFRLPALGLPEQLANGSYAARAYAAFPLHLSVAK
jgi:hypothetical protein